MPLLKCLHPFEGMRVAHHLDQLLPRKNAALLGCRANQLRSKLLCGRQRPRRRAQETFEDLTDPSLGVTAGNELVHQVQAKSLGCGDPAGAHHEVAGLLRRHAQGQQ